MIKNVTYIISNIDKALAFEWISSYLNKEEFNLNFILLNAGDSDLERYFIQNKIKVDRITYRGKKSLFKAVIKTYRLLKKYKTDIVHTHLFDATWLALRQQNLRASQNEFIQGIIPITTIYTILKL